MNSFSAGTREAEIDQLQRRGVLRADKIPRADVAMDVARLVNGLERLGRLPQPA